MNYKGWIATTSQDQRVIDDLQREIDSLRQELAETKAEGEMLSVACKRAVEMNSDNVRAWEQDAAAKDAELAKLREQVEELKGRIGNALL